MPVTLYRIYCSIMFLLPLPLIVFISMSFIKFVEIRKWKYFIIGMTLLVILLLIAFYDFTLAITGVTLANKRNMAIRDLELLVAAQNQFHKKHERYADSFQELRQEDPASIVKTSTYTFYLHNDEVPSGNFKTEACLANIDTNHIYAIDSITQLGRDVISIDYSGQIEIIESFDFWPLPYPKGARKYKGPK